MKLSELIETLNDFVVAGDPEVLIATQPNWPLQTYIQTVTLVGDTLYIAEGSSPWDAPYAPRSAWDGGYGWDPDADEE